MNIPSVTRRLMVVALLVGIPSLASYSLGGHVAWRFLSPHFGAWFNLSEFWLMEGAAVAFGLMLGTRVASKLILSDSQPRAEIAALATSLVLLAPLTWLFATVARIGWLRTSLPDLVIGLFGYEAGNRLDNILSAGVYFIKTSIFAALLGAALFGSIGGALSFQDSVRTPDAEKAK